VIRFTALTCHVNAEHCVLPQISERTAGRAQHSAARVFRRDIRIVKELGPAAVALAAADAYGFGCSEARRYTAIVLTIDDGLGAQRSCVDDQRVDREGRGFVTGGFIMWRIWTTRVFAFCLAVSGVWMLPTVGLIVFVPGLFIWLGWIAIAVGWRWLNHPLFWLCCLLWDGYWGMMLFSETDWGSYNKAPIYWHARWHVAASVVLSAAAIALLLVQHAVVSKAAQQQNN
jgi:hypothetical protein